MPGSKRIKSVRLVLSSFALLLDEAKPAGVPAFYQVCSPSDCLYPPGASRVGECLSLWKEEDARAACWTLHTQAL